MVETEVIDGLGEVAFGDEEERKSDNDDAEVGNEGAALYDKNLFAQELGDLEDDDVDFD